MSDPKPFKKKYLVSFWGVRCFMDGDGMVVGTNIFFDAMIPIVVFFHNAMSFITALMFPFREQPGFPFKILKRFPEGCSPKRWGKKHE